MPFPCPCTEDDPRPGSDPRSSSVDLFPSRDAGFSLLEVVLVVALVGLVVTLIYPAGGNYVVQAMGEQTRREMCQLADAVERYYYDTESVPPDLAALMTEPAGASGWKGPYLALAFSNSASMNDDHAHDRWLEPYIYEIESSAVINIRSKGVNRSDESGDGDDLQVSVNLTPVRRRITREELEDINIAVDRFNEENELHEQLSQTYDNCARWELQTAGVYPSDSAAKAKFQNDAWGQNYRAVGSPILAVESDGPPSP